MLGQARKERQRQAQSQVPRQTRKKQHQAQAKYWGKQDRNNIKHLSQVPEARNPRTKRRNTTTIIVPTNGNSVEVPLVAVQQFIYFDRPGNRYRACKGPDFAQGGYSLLVEVFERYQALADKEYERNLRHIILISNQNNPIKIN